MGEIPVKKIKAFDNLIWQLRQAHCWPRQYKKQGVMSNDYECPTCRKELWSLLRKLKLAKYFFNCRYIYPTQKERKEDEI